MIFDRCCSYGPIVFYTLEDKELNGRLQKIYRDETIPEHEKTYGFETASRQKKEILYEDLYVYRKSSSLSDLERFIELAKEKASKLHKSNISVTSSGSGISIIAYYYETEKEIINRISDQIELVEKSKIRRDEQRYQEYLKLKKEFEK